MGKREDICAWGNCQERVGKGVFTARVTHTFWDSTREGPQAYCSRSHMILHQVKHLHQVSSQVQIIAFLTQLEQLIEKECGR